MSRLRGDEPSPSFGIEALVDVDGPAATSRAPGYSQPRQDGLHPGRALRRDLHWWLGGALLLLALPVLVWQAVGSEENGGGVQHRAGAAGTATGSDRVRPPESTSALDRTIDDQARLGSLPALPPLSTMPLAASRPALQRAPGTGAIAPGMPLAAGADRSATLPAVPDAVDPLSSRKDALAAEQERRVAEARASPMLAIGSAAGGPVAPAVIGASAAALGALVRDAAPGSADRLATAGIPTMPIEALASRGMTSGDTRSDSAWLEQVRARRSDEPGPGGTWRPAPASPAVLEGTVIPAVLLTEINSDLPGTLVAQVTQDIWDSVHGRTLLVPKGSRLVGDYNSDVRPGQERVLAAFRRLILPDGSSIDLMGTQATDAQGRSGLQDRVDRHFWTMFGSSFIVAAIASFVQRREALPSTVIVVPGGAGTAASAVSSAAGTVLVETSRAILGRSRNMAPTLLIGQGHRFSLTVQKTFSLASPDDGTNRPFSR